MSTPMLIFQRRAVEWGAKGRSALMTARRRDLPRIYPLPAVPDGMVALAQNIEWNDADGFSQARESTLYYATLTGIVSAEMDFSGTSDSLELVPLAGGLGGVVRLRVGQVARYEWNEYLDETGRARHTLISVGLFAPPLRAAALEKLPDYYVSHLIDLNQRRRKAGQTL